MINHKPTVEEMEALWKVCTDFIDEQRIGCEEVIYQTDWVIENAYEFIERICDVVGYDEEEE